MIFAAGIGTAIEINHRFAREISPLAETIVSAGEGVHVSCERTWLYLHERSRPRATQTAVLCLGLGHVVMGYVEMLTRFEPLYLKSQFLQALSHTPCRRVAWACAVHGCAERFDQPSDTTECTFEGEMGRNCKEAVDKRR